MPIARVIHVQNALGTMYFLFSAFGTAFVVIGLLLFLCAAASTPASSCTWRRSCTCSCTMACRSISPWPCSSRLPAVIACVYAVWCFYQA